MDRETLDARNAATVRKWARAMTDRPGTIPQGMLDEFAQTADEHATNRLAAEQLSDAAVETWIRTHPGAFSEWVGVNGADAWLPVGEPVRPGVVVPADADQTAVKPAGRKRTTTTT